MTVETSQSSPAIPEDIPASDREVSNDGTVVDAVNILLRYRRLIVASSVVAGLVSLLISLLLPPMYVATTTFVPDVGSAQSRLAGGFAGLSGLAGLAGLAGQLGVSLSGDASRSPRFYADVARSREVLEQVLLTRFSMPGSPNDSAALLAIMGVHGRDSLDRLQRGTKRLARHVTAQVSNQTGIVELRIETKDPMLSARVADRFVDLLNEFNAHTRQTRARERRRFVEERVTDGEHSLRVAEDELRRFYEKNRSWQQAPQLVFEEGRLRRQVEVQQELYLTLRREYEAARIEEVNDTPTITVIDRATPPRRRSNPNVVLFTALGICVGGLLSVLFALGRDYATQFRLANTAGYRELRRLMLDARTDLRTITRRGRG